MSSSVSSQGERVEARHEADDFPTLSADALGLSRTREEHDRSACREVECLEDGVWVVRNVLSKEECAAICGAASAQMVRNRS